MNLLLPGRWELLGALVVACQPVDTALDQNQSELGVLVLAVPLQMLAHGDGLLDQVVQVLGNLRAQSWTSHTHSSQLHNIDNAFPKKKTTQLFSMALM